MSAPLDPLDVVALEAVAASLDDGARLALLPPVLATDDGAPLWTALVRQKPNGELVVAAPVDGTEDRWAVLTITGEKADSFVALLLAGGVEATAGQVAP